MNKDQNFFIFVEKYSSRLKKKILKNERYIKIANRNLISNDLFRNFHLAIHNGLAFIPVFMDNNKINFMLGIFSARFSIKLKKKIKIYKKKKKK